MLKIQQITTLTKLTTIITLTRVLNWKVLEAIENHQKVIQLRQDQFQDFINVYNNLNPLRINAFVEDFEVLN